MMRAYVTSAEIGAVIRKRRKELGYSQEQLAEKVGLSYQQIQRYENGSSMLNVENVQRIAQALALGIEDVFAAEPLRGSAIQEHPVSEEERALLRIFRDLGTRSDRRLAVSVVRRLAKRG
jgi:transcriptional regulator with XRE-family HTH domain